MDAISLGDLFAYSLAVSGGITALCELIGLTVKIVEITMRIKK